MYEASEGCVVHHFQCVLCDAGYVGYTCQHLYQRIEEHKGSAIGNHLREQHNMAPNEIARSFKNLMKCQNKLYCLIFEILLIKELKPILNRQCHSIRAKIFVYSRTSPQRPPLYNCISACLNLSTTATATKARPQLPK